MKKGKWILAPFLPVMLGLPCLMAGAAGIVAWRLGDGMRILPARLCFAAVAGSIAGGAAFRVVDLCLEACLEWRERRRDR